MKNQSRNEDEVEMDEKIYDGIFEEMRGEKSAEKTTPVERPKKFIPLPDGAYVGEVYVQPKTVSGAENENYGLKKLEFRLTVREGAHSGQMAFIHRVLMPRHLGTPPPADSPGYAKWRASVKVYLARTDHILENCGIDTSDTDKNRFVQKIALNNRRSRLVNFTVKNGQAYINYPIVKAVEDEEDSLLKGGSGIPDGNDAPL